MAWLTRSGTIDKDATDEIERQGDRGAAIMAGSYLEDHLALAIKDQMIGDTNAVKKAFDVSGPLANFNSKIEMAYLFKLISKSEAGEMHIVRRIRNEFAHNLRPLTFEVPRIADRCKTLSTHASLIALRERTKAEFEDRRLMFSLILVGVLEAMIALPDTPRNSYLNSVQLLVLRLSSRWSEKLAHPSQLTIGVAGMRGWAEWINEVVEKEPPVK